MMKMVNLQVTLEQLAESLRRLSTEELEALPTAARKEVKTRHLPTIAASPLEAGQPLSGPLTRFRTHVFSHGGVSYRVVYEIG